MLVHDFLSKSNRLYDICFLSETFWQNVLFFFKIAAFLEGASGIFQRVIIFLKNLFIDILAASSASRYVFLNFLSYVTLWWFVRAYELWNLLFACIYWSSDWFLNFLHYFASSLFTSWWISELFSDGLFYCGTRWDPKFLPDGFLNCTLAWVVLKSIIGVVIDWLLDFLLNVFWLIDLFILCFFKINMAKIRRFWNIFIKKLFQFVFSFADLSFHLSGFWLDWFLVGICKRDSLFGFWAFFENGWKDGILIIEWEVSVGLFLLFEG